MSRSDDPYRRTILPGLTVRVDESHCIVLASTAANGEGIVHGHTITNVDRLVDALQDARDFVEAVERGEVVS